jgi:histidinol dehydrogenase
MSVQQTVSQIIEEVRRRGDTALVGYARKFDRLRISPAQLRVTPRELQEARRRVSAEFLKTLRECSAQVRAFAENERKRLPASWMLNRSGARIGQLIRPVDSTGLYIPGGRFPYPSTVLMTAIPARVAGVKRVIMTSPPANLTPEVLAAAAFAGVDEIYRVGGAGAIAAMALGTSRIKPVALIVGPGNQYVTEAKRQLYGTVGIDLLAGPSEVVIIADGKTPAAYVEADLMAQAEHDPSARSVLCTTDARLIAEVRKRLDPRIKERVRFEKVRSLDQAIERANAIAPEHLELLFANAERALPKIRHAGAIFLGPASPAAMGDYVAGPSHVLPTRGAAHFSSGLSVLTFLKRSSVIGFNGRRSELAQWKAALQMAETEGMQHHARSLRLRLERTR